MARGLLDHRNPDTKFFGALTFIVKINQSWYVVRHRSPHFRRVSLRLIFLYRSDLSDESVHQLKTYLINSYVALIESGEKHHVTRKLAAALVAVFFNDPCWTHPLQDTGVAFWSKGHEGYSEIDFEGLVLPALNEAQISGLLSFGVIMAEESVKNSSLVRKRSVAAKSVRPFLY